MIGCRRDPEDGTPSEFARRYDSRVPEVSAAGIRLYYEERGTGDAVPCIHGYL
jgi:hypothetical protein